MIINGSAAELTDVNAGGSDVAAGVVSGNLALDATELATVAALNSVAVMQPSATDAEKLDVAGAILDAVGVTTGGIAEIREKFSAAEEAQLTALVADPSLSAIDLSTATLRKQFRLKRSVQELQDLADFIGSA